MQLILNKKVVLLLCFTINILHFIECSTESHPDKAHGATVHKSTDAESLDVSQNVTKLKLDDTVASKSEHAKNLRNMGGVVQHNYRSSYVGNRLNRRVATATATAAPIAQKQQPTVAEVASATKTTSSDDNDDAQIPLIKAKRKFDSDFSEEIKYNVGPGVNIGVEKEKELVSVYLDEDCLKDVFTGKFD